MEPIFNVLIFSLLALLIRPLTWGGLYYYFYSTKENLSLKFNESRFLKANSYFKESFSSSSFKPIYKDRRENEERLEIYTDGGCWWKSGMGGIGIYMIYKDYVKEFNLRFENTTVNRMELIAVITALKLIKRNLPIVIYSDSKYVVNGINSWRNKWELEGWIGIKNLDIWKYLNIELSRFSNIRFCHVKGHNGNEGNEMADFLVHKQSKTKIIDTHNIKDYINIIEELL